MGGGLDISPNLLPHTQGGPQTWLIRACLLRKETGQCLKSLQAEWAQFDIAY